MKKVLIISTSPRKGTVIKIVISIMLLTGCLSSCTAKKPLTGENLNQCYEFVSSLLPNGVFQIELGLCTGGMTPSKNAKNEWTFKGTGKVVNLTLFSFDAELASGKYSALTTGVDEKLYIPTGYKANSFATGQKYKLWGLFPLPIFSRVSTASDGKAELYDHLTDGTITVERKGQQYSININTSNLTAKFNQTINPSSIVRKSAIKPAGDNRYYELMMDLGPEEAKYMKFGPLEVDTFTAQAPGSLGKFTSWYPKEMKTSKKKYPVIISNNGTGWGMSKYCEWFRHMASWGFVVVGNEEGTSWNGNSAEASLQWILKIGESSGSVFYHHLDTNNIGTIGHSQGGTGVENAVTVQPSAKRYRCAVMLASTYNGKNDFLRWDADASKIRVPMMILVANDDGLTPMKDYNAFWNALPKDIIKVVGRRTECGHGDMLVFGDGYVTAWFLWHLQGNSKAHKAIMELKENKKYVEVRIHGI